jgi:ferritin
MISALSVCYLAGLVSMKIWMALAASDAEQMLDRTARHVEQADRSVDTQADLGQSIRKHDKLPIIAQLDQPNDVSPPSPYQMLRQLGHEQERKGKVQAALDYYRSALDAATDEELPISYGEDSWLLMSLKQDRQDTYVSKSPSVKRKST